VGAHTERVQLAGNVHNIPLRPPAVLARSAASLDRLTNGRMALGLGTGGFWDALVAMGPDRRVPGEATIALAEAIGVIREIWDTDTRIRSRSGWARTARGCSPSSAPPRTAGCPR